MAGRGLGGKKYSYKESRRVAMNIIDFDIKNWADGMIGINKRTSFYYLATKYISARLINVAAVILYEAVKRCPYESGELRSSGHVTLVAGKVTGMDVAIKTDAGPDGTFAITKLQNHLSKPAGVIEMAISFDKQVKGQDLALWAHEELLDYVKRPKSEEQKGSWYATHYRTGPKYLERAFKIKKADIPREVQRGLNQAVREYNRKHKTRARRRG
jgi:hypothetical protein